MFTAGTSLWIWPMFLSTVQRSMNFGDISQRCGSSLCCCCWWCRRTEIYKKSRSLWMLLRKKRRMTENSAFREVQILMLFQRVEGQLIDQWMGQRTNGCEEKRSQLCSWVWACKVTTSSRDCVLLLVHPPPPFHLNICSVFFKSLALHLKTLYELIFGIPALVFRLVTSSSFQQPMQSEQCKHIWLVCQTRIPLRSLLL